MQIIFNIAKVFHVDDILIFKFEILDNCYFCKILWTLNPIKLKSSQEKDLAQRLLVLNKILSYKILKIQEKNLKINKFKK